MKKNVVGNLVAPKEKPKSFFKRYDLLPRMLCLLLAVVVWLLVVNVQSEAEHDKELDLGMITDVIS